MKYKYHLITSFIALSACLLGLSSLASQHRPLLIKTGVAFIPLSDTSSFLAGSGWTRATLYLAQETQDSAMMELITIKNTGMAGATEEFLGTITNSLYQPLSQQNIVYQLLPGNTWQVRIAADGKCYIRQIDGNSVPGDPRILFIKIRYKNK